MEKEKLYLASCNNRYILKKDTDYYVLLSEEDLKSLGYDCSPAKKCGIFENDKDIYPLMSLNVSHEADAEKVSAKWVNKEDVMNLSYRPADKLYIREMLDGRKNIDLFAVYRGELLATAYDKGRMNPFVAFFRHLHTVNNHRRIVRKECFKVGLYWQGLVHDLSKYSPTEFLVGVKYYQGTRSPNVAERMTIGYSTAWLHHKGRNKHHQEYWTDYSFETGNILEFKEMPRKYFVESILDRIAACKVYRGKNYNDGSALDYLLTRDSEKNMNRKNHDEMIRILTMLKEKGEKETFYYLKHVYLKGKE